MGLFKTARHICGLLTDYDRTITEYIAERAGLPVVWETYEGELKRNIALFYEAVLADRDYSKILADFENYFKNSRQLDTGRYVYVQQVRALLAIIGRHGHDLQACERELDHVRNWWLARGRDVPSSAVYAMALAQTAVAHCDQHTSCDHGLRHVDCVECQAKFDEFIKAARNLFWEQREAAADCYLWHRFYFQFGLIEGAGESALAQRFETLQAFNHYDLSIYADRIPPLLPRYGGHLQALDLFARKAVMATKTRYGSALYAYLYQLAFETDEQVWEAVAAGRSLCDWPLLAKGYEDWMKNFAADRQYAANGFANAALAFGHQASLRRLFREVIKEYHPAAWQTPLHTEDALKLARRKTLQIA